jgi:hypothetical protein
MADVGGRIIERFASNLAVQCATGAVPAAAGSGGGSTAASGGGAGMTAVGDGAGAAASGREAPPIPIEDLHLPVRAFNSLRREGIHTVGDLSTRNEADLLAIANLGPQSVSEIKQKLAERGLELGGAAAEAEPVAAGSTGGAAAAAPSPAATAQAAPPQFARPPDEDAIDLLSVAGFPVLKRALPAVGVVVALIMLLLLGRRRRRQRAPRA